ncbi:AmmeMemoRadiSam system radical SAM enzyme [Candidatus Peregrinibacteria bacterium RIFCSPLOWO2_01_FULL_39_12]|nr:MAG: AmmeMemoRadiSam system radical SAM enzyme [Candidatus Peregrinibacteria bacterium RIFCSPLOWO2_02_FULL_39_10]OGJ42662.1 MAG: AmmeMemoRadiSam system radical SAM enzyme [Candidatus Peregrinibacteria bacterium RIFCSPLOWO2_01_FULL_39_12]
MMKKAVLFKKLGGKKVKCLCCQRYCVIKDGLSGFCGVRKNVNGELYLIVYGKPIAVHTDPVEKKPLFHFLPGTEIFSFGTIGCNFRCSFCQNWDISQITARMIGKIRGARRELSPKKIVDYCVKNKIPSIAYTYNEPTIFTEYAHDTGVLARKKGIKNVYVSNGYESEECLKYMLNFCDAINIDIKSFSNEFYAKVCGGVRLNGVKETIKKSFEMGFWIECTTLVIPELNDSDKELKEIAEFLVAVSPDIPWHVTAFHPDYKMTDKKFTPAATLEKAVEIGKKAGLKFVYTGNILNPDGENTYCPKCKKLLIERSGMSCLTCDIKTGKNGVGTCPYCKEKIAGIWK